MLLFNCVYSVLNVILMPPSVFYEFYLHCYLNTIYSPVTEITVKTELKLLNLLIQVIDTITSLSDILLSFNTSLSSFQDEQLPLSEEQAGWCSSATFLICRQGLLQEARITTEAHFFIYVLQNTITPQGQT